MSDDCDVRKNADKYAQSAKKMIFERTSFIIDKSIEARQGLKIITSKFEAIRAKMTNKLNYNNIMCIS